jgi:transposase
VSRAGWFVNGEIPSRAFLTGIIRLRRLPNPKTRAHLGGVIGYCVLSQKFMLFGFWLFRAGVCHRGGMTMHACVVTGRGRKPVPVVLTDRVRAELERLVGDDEVNDQQRLRARIVLGAAQGRSNRELAEQLGCSEVTVSTWRRRFVETGPAGLADQQRLADATRPGRPLAPLVLSAAQRAVLERWCRRRRRAAGLAQRARIVLLADEVYSNGEVARRLGCTAATVRKWRGRFVEQGLEGLSDEYRPGTPRTIGNERVEEVIAKPLDELLTDGSTHWSTRSMADAVGCPSQRSAASGGRSDCARIATNRSSCPPTRTLSTKSTTSSGCI